MQQRTQPTHRKPQAQKLSAAAVGGVADVGDSDPWPAPRTELGVIERGYKDDRKVREGLAS